MQRESASVHDVSQILLQYQLIMLRFRLPLHSFNGPFSKTTRVSRYQQGKTNLDFTEATDSEWQWHQLGNTRLKVNVPFFRDYPGNPVPER